MQLDALANGYGVMNGSQENPPNNSSAKGFGYAALNYPDMDTLFYLVGFDGLVPTAAHIHNGAAGKNGPIFTALTPSNFPGIYFGQAPISGDMLTAFLKMNCILTFIPMLIQEVKFVDKLKTIF